MLAAVFLLVFGVLACVSKCAAFDNNTPLNILNNVNLQGIKERALEYVSQSSFTEIFASLVTFFTALFTDPSTLTPEVIEAAYASLSFIGLVIMILLAVVSFLSVVKRIAQVGLLVAVLAALVIYVVANYDYLLAVLGVKV